MGHGDRLTACRDAVSGDTGTTELPPAIAISDEAALLPRCWRVSALRTRPTSSLVRSSPVAALSA